MTVYILQLMIEKYKAHRAVIFLIYLTIVQFSFCSYLSANDGSHLQLDGKSAIIEFSGNIDSIRTGGRFNQVNASLLYDPQKNLITRVSFETNVSTVTFTEGGLKERMFLQAIASRLPQATARYSSSSVSPTGPDSYVSDGIIKVFGKDFRMKIPFNVHSKEGKKLRISGSLKDKGKVLPFEVPGLSGNFNGVLKFDLMFIP
ncbi:MAG: hypothetical protein GYA55_01670 [SAR324 cluster bacterium]|uniref:Lipid/polyisoprenoid-binding YceI-like domain-containing protein n=1 Tax=SAR324 cluster bacterium TaxID=2024889 RepID=A0A7X9FQ60_9DELT|nr:hypothetical protein [SAR324 cluster bacterium]